jgi:hypothetical protein
MRWDSASAVHENLLSSGAAGAGAGVLAAGMVEVRTGAEAEASSELAGADAGVTGAEIMSVWVFSGFFFVFLSYIKQRGMRNDGDHRLE